MKLLVVSHACVAPINQQLYAEVQGLTGWDISLVVPSNWRDEYGRDCTIERWPAFNGRLLPLPVSRPGNIILHTYRTSFSRLVREEAPDAIYMHQEPYAAATAQVYWANVRAGGRKPIGFYSAQNIQKKYKPPFRWTESWVLRSSAFAFPISTAVDDVLRRKGYAGTSTILPLAIDSDVYYPREDASAARAELVPNVSEQDAIIGYVGRFVPEKGLATLLDAVSQIADVPWRLALIGAGPMESELRRMAESKGVADRVTFSGFVPHLQVPRMLSAMDLLVLPSETQANWREQFGRVVLEAMACGTPVVGSDSGEIPNLINATGGGVVFRERDPQHLAQCLRQMIIDPGRRRELAAAGVASVAKMYTVKRIAEMFARTIEAASSSARHAPAHPAQPHPASLPA